MDTKGFRPSTNVEDLQAHNLSWALNMLTAPFHVFGDIARDPFNKETYMGPGTPPASPLGAALGYGMAGDPPPLDVMQNAQLEGATPGELGAILGGMLPNSEWINRKFNQPNDQLEQYNQPMPRLPEP